MANKSDIEWTEASWNPVTGCTKVTSGCKNCYAERLAYRLQTMGVKNYKNGFKVTCHQDMLTKPLKWKTPRLIFVNSMSDLFHEEVPIEFIKSIFEIMNKADWHIFQILTKRTKRLIEIDKDVEWTENIWMGTTIEDSNVKDRLLDLKRVPALYKFISFEPLLSSINIIDLTGIDWVIVGGESGPNARLMKKEWVLEIKKKCELLNIPFFFKQWGGVNKKKNGRLLNGKIWNEMPNNRLCFI